MALKYRPKDASSATLRPYRPADRAAVIALVRELQVHEAALYDRMKPPEEIGVDYLEGLLRDCAAEAGEILVAESPAGHLLGYAVVLTAVSSAAEADEQDYLCAVVKDLAVTEAARGQGLGRRLLAACEGRARDAGAPWLRISVLADNRGALETYRKFGFRDLFLQLEKPLEP